MAIAKEYQFRNTSGEIFRGKIIKGYVALYVSDKYWILAKGYSLYKYYPKTDEIEPFSKIVDPLISFASRFKLFRRFLRAEITKLYRFNGEWFCIARKGIFKYNSDSKIFEVCHAINKGSRPLNLCQDKDGTIYYGEYFNNPTKTPVAIYATKDLGSSWYKAFEFSNGEINHVHGIFIDKFTGRLWVFTGDEDSACIAGYTNDGFKTFVKEFEGRQQFRVCVPLFVKDHIIYPTDSQYVPNSIRQIDRQTKEIKDLKLIQGSGIYAIDAGNVYLISTTVEPSKINLDKESHLWYSFDGYSWNEFISFKKDIYSQKFFQFGSIRFPNYEIANDCIVVTGRSIVTLDQSTLIVPIKQLSK